MRRAYYNEFCPKTAAWLRELIKAGLIADGDVDERSIAEVSPQDLTPYAQCHFFAGIGGWSYALRLAGVPDGFPVWTGSCPCQPFSAAGNGLGEADERHLWPVFRELIRACKPSVVFGEQVASKAGRVWLSGVFADLEGMAYQRAGADLCAAGVSAPHIRQRIYWMGHSEAECWNPFGNHEDATERSEFEAGVGSAARGVGDSRCERDESGRRSGNVGCTAGQKQGEARQREWGGNANPSSGFNGAWDRCDQLPCRDGKSRRVESGTFPLAHGVSGRVGLLRGYGNAIVPQIAAEFISASFEAIQDMKAA